jgi:TP901 family phage tail tape measure protein
MGREAIGGAFQAANDFETQMAKVQTVMQGNTQFQGQFSAGIRSMSMEFGIATKDLSQSLYDILSAGVSAGQALDVLREATKLSIGGFADMATTTRGLTSLMNAYQIQAQDVVIVADQMQQAAIQGKLEFSDFARVMGYIAPYAHESGVALSDMATSLSVITNTGSSAQSAATQLLNLIKGFNRPSKQSAAAAKQFGIELGHNQIAGDNFLKTLQKLAAVQAKHGPESLGRIFPDLRGARGIAGLLDRISEFGKFSDQIKNSSGAAEQAFKTMSQTGQFQLNRLKQTMIQVSVAFGQAIQPMIIQYGQVIQTNLPVIMAWIQAHQTAIQTAVKWSAAILGIMIVAPRLVATIRLLSFTMQAFVSSLRITATLISAAFANPIMAAAVVAVTLFAAVVARSILYNETWTQSAYGMLRALGMFHGNVQNFSAAMEEYGKAANEALRTASLAAAAKAGNQPLNEQIQLMNDAIDAQRKLIAASQEVQKTAKEASAETTFTQEQIVEQQQKIADMKAKMAKDPWGGPRKEDLTQLEDYLAYMQKNMKPLSDAGFSDAFIEKQKKKLNELQAQLEELMKKQNPQFDFKEFRKQFPGLEDTPLTVTVKPQFRGIAEMADIIQKAVFGTEFDPAVKSNNDNTAATKDNTAALKTFTTRIQDTVVSGGLVLGR